MKSISTIEKVFITLILLNSGTPITADSHFSMFFLVFIFVLMVFSGKIHMRRGGKTVAVCLVIFVVWFFQFIFDVNSSLDLLVISKVWLSLVCMFLFTSSNSEQNKERFFYFIRVIYITSIISNILFVLLIFRVPIPTIQVYSKTVPSFFYLENYAISENYGILGFRNSGIFWEPGMYQIYLNLLLLVNLFRKDITSKRKLFLAIYCCVSIISTGSVTGYLLCIIIVASFGFTGIKRLSSKIIVLVILAVLSLFALPYANRMIITKMTVGHSFFSRVSDITVGLDFFKKNPIWGYGVYSTEYAKYYGTIYGIERGNTNGLITVLLQFGVIGGVFLIFQLARFGVFMKNAVDGQNWFFVPFLFWMILSFCNEPIANHVFVFFIIGIGLSSESICSFQKYQLRAR